ncbi:MAG TPA: hypothetical protein VGZ47_04830 [Gemmataceae bacterium]|jgi:hypothetical protein|nr:hypothetical protein [Gemmataceae bacterium]
MPRRSVTRFFIPLIDVLILMFCIFLLMPFVKATGEGADTGEGTKPPPAPEIKDIAELNRQLDQAQKDLAQSKRDLERLEKDKANLLRGLVIRTLEIDKDTGRLYYYDDDQRVEIRNETDARRLISAEQDRILKAGGGDLYFLFQRPRDSSFPLGRQRADYERWFQGVAYGGF